jgi:nucleotide-binding universal stress UspA family protein
MERGAPLQRVVAGVDLTPVSRRVVERAQLLAAAHGAALELVGVSGSAQDAFIPDGLARLLHKHRVARLEELADWCRQKGQGAVTTLAVKGSPAWELVRAGKHADVLVVGSSSVDAGRVGPVTRQIAQLATADVLVVRRQPRGHYRKVVAAVDFSRVSEMAVSCALKLVPEAEVTAVFSLPTRFDPLLTEAGLFNEEVSAARASRLRSARHRMDEFVATWPGRVQPMVVDGPPMETLDEVVRRVGADLLSVASRGAGATKMTLLGPIAEGLLGSVPTDVLVCRVPGEFRRP